MDFNLTGNHAFKVVGDFRKIIRPAFVQRERGDYRYLATEISWRLDPVLASATLVVYLLWRPENPVTRLALWSFESI